MSAPRLRVIDSAEAFRADAERYRDLARADHRTAAERRALLAAAKDAAAAAASLAPTAPTVETPSDEVRATLTALLELRRNGVVFDDRFAVEAKPAELLTLAADLEARAAVLRGLAETRTAPPRA
jgi:hypothetical protein